jgi:hypothetical protein
VIGPFLSTLFSRRLSSEWYDDDDDDDNNNNKYLCKSTIDSTLKLAI